MSDLIERQAAVEKILRNKDAKPLNESDYQDGIRAGLDIAYCEIRDMPSAEPVHGEWVTVGHTNGLNGTCWAECSVCGSPGDLFDKYCRVCGADMRGGK